MFFIKPLAVINKSAMINFWEAGGIVMGPLMGFSILSVALILERLFFWFPLLVRQESVVRKFLDHYSRVPSEEMIEKKLLPSLRKNAHLPIPRIFLAALELQQPTPEEFRLALESASQAEFPLLKRFNTVFETLISVSPLLGLLGTVLGLINSFASLKMGDVGGTNATEVTGGISQALISTAAGLVIAIFTLLFANMFRSFYQRQRALILEYGGQLELLYRHLHEKIR